MFPDRRSLEPARDILHGKDCVALLAEILLAHGVSRSEADRLIRVSFEGWMVGRAQRSERGRPLSRGMRSAANRHHHVCVVRLELTPRCSECPS